MSARVFAQVLQTRYKSAAHKLVMAAIASRANNDGAGAFPSQAELSDAAMVTVRTVRRLVNDLVDTGHLEVSLHAGGTAERSAAGRRCNSYRIISVDPVGGQTVPQSPIISGHVVPQPFPVGGQTVPQLPIISGQIDNNWRTNQPELADTAYPVSSHDATYTSSLNVPPYRETPASVNTPPQRWTIDKIAERAGAIWAKQRAEAGQADHQGGLAKWKTKQLLADSRPLLERLSARHDVDSIDALACAALGEPHALARFAETNPDAHGGDCAGGCDGTGWVAAARGDGVVRCTRMPEACLLDELAS